MAKLLNRHQLKSGFSIIVFVLLVVILVGGLIWLFYIRYSKSDNKSIEYTNDTKSVISVKMDLPDKLDGSQIVAMNSNIVLKGRVLKNENNIIEISSDKKNVSLQIEEKTKFFEVKPGSKTAVEIKRESIKSNQNVLVYLNYDQLRDRISLSRIIITETNQSN